MIKNIVTDIDIDLNNRLKASKCKQNDTINWILELYKNGDVADLSKETIIVNVRKPDDTYILQTKNITYKDNVLTIKLDPQATTVIGTAKLSITLTSNTSDRVTTFSKELEIIEDDLNSAIPSESVITIIDQIDQAVINANENLDNYVATANNTITAINTAIQNGDISTMKSDITALKGYIDNYAIDVTSFGAVGDGVTDSTTAIRRAIVTAKESTYTKRVFIPSGTYIISQPLYVDGVVLEGVPGETILKQKDDTQMNALIVHIGTYPTLRGTGLYGLILDGGNNTTFSDNNKLTQNLGIRLSYTHYSTLKDIEIRNFGLDGILMTGTAGDDWNLHNTTNRLENISIYGCHRYSINLTDAANDNKFVNLDIGNNQYGINVLGGSNSFYDSTIWGTVKGPGMKINGPQNMIRGCNFEGNSLQGLTVTTYGSHSKISDCKFLANSKSNPGTYQDIYISGESTKNVENLDITNNLFLGSSSNADGTGYPQRAIGMESTHSGVNISGNKYDYDTNGTVQDLTLLQVYGLQSGDTFDNVKLISNTGSIQYYQVPQGSLYLELDTGFMVYPNYVLQKWVYVGVNTTVIYDNPDGAWIEGGTLSLGGKVSDYRFLLVLLRFGGEQTKILDFVSNTSNKRRCINVTNAPDAESSKTSHIGELIVDLIDDTTIQIYNNIYRVHGANNVDVYKNSEDCINIKKIIGVK